MSEFHALPQAVDTYATNYYVRRLAADTGRHLLLVTATPQSGKEDGFPTLSLLNHRLTGVDLDQVAGRALLARHFIQRRRGDVRSYLDTLTPDEITLLNPATRTCNREAVPTILDPAPGEGPGLPTGRLDGTDPAGHMVIVLCFGKGSG
jgi:hypothetical protein